LGHVGKAHLFRTPASTVITFKSVGVITTVTITTVTIAITITITVTITITQNHDYSFLFSLFPTTIITVVLVQDLRRIA
jgi:hypothetical protein